MRVAGGEWGKGGGDFFRGRGLGVFFVLFFVVVVFFVVVFFFFFFFVFFFLLFFFFFFFFKNITILGMQEKKMALKWV